VTCALNVPGALIDGTHKATILTGDSPDAYNDIESPDRVAPEQVALTFQNGAVSLPPHSLVVIDVT
jgi:alpha-N-arabinofuranosidase